MLDLDALTLLQTALSPAVCPGLFLVPASAKARPTPVAMRETHRSAPLSLGRGAGGEGIAA